MHYRLDGTLIAIDNQPVKPVNHGGTSHAGRDSEVVKR
jgi:hypothetical protein